MFSFAVDGTGPSRYRDEGFTNRMRTALCLGRFTSILHNMKSLHSGRFLFICYQLAEEVDQSLGHTDAPSVTPKPRICRGLKRLRSIPRRQGIDITIAMKTVRCGDEAYTGSEYIDLTSLHLCYINLDFGALIPPANRHLMDLSSSSGARLVNEDYDRLSDIKILTPIIAHEIFALFKLDLRRSRTSTLTARDIALSIGVHWKTTSYTMVLILEIRPGGDEDGVAKGQKGVDLPTRDTSTPCEA
ncbi:hypothetical protein PM082_002091 [Marasmius tenuissimus]|nr:hypothetical protein PM082_002091 [Marasmius tenuissimus]